LAGTVYFWTNKENKRTADMKKGLNNAKRFSFSAVALVCCWCGFQGSDSGSGVVTQ
jgi:hypothetical protein